MVNQKLSAFLCLSSLTVGGLLAAPLAAEDEKTVGLLAGIGVAAATGKTSLGAGAGAIEAGLLGTDNFQHAGAILAGLINHKHARQPIIVVTRDEKVDLASWRLLSTRIAEVNALVGQCPAAPGKAVPPAAPGVLGLYKGMLPKGTTFSASDFVGAGLTDVSISGITLTAEDRLLATALLMNANAALPDTPAGFWRAAPETFAAAAAPADYKLAGDTADLPASGTVQTNYENLVGTIKANRTLCSGSDVGKAILTIADAFVTSFTSVGPNGIPLANARQLEQLATGDPAILRVAIEQVGGTSVAKSGIAYTFGWPNAATVAAGLLVSFRLTNPKTGKIESLGLIRCMMSQSNLKRITKILKRQDEGTTDAENLPYAIGKPYCDYRVSNFG